MQFLCCTDDKVRWEIITIKNNDTIRMDIRDNGVGPKFLINMFLLVSCFAFVSCYHLVGLLRNSNSWKGIVCSLDIWDGSSSSSRRLITS